MENQQNVTTQNIPKTDLNPLNQNSVEFTPVKPKPNFWMMATIALCLTIIVGGIFYFRNVKKNSIPQSNNNVSTTQPTESSPNEDIFLDTKFAYLKTVTKEFRGPGEIVISNFDGSSKQTIHTVPIYVGPYSGNDISDKNDKVIYNSFIEDQYGNVTEKYLWVSSNGKEPRKILTLGNKEGIESPIISADGEKIAYSLLVRNTDNYFTDTEQLWTINADGTENKLIIDKTRDYLGNNSRFRLAPVSWSLDKTKIYLQSTSDSEATPIGIHVANLLTGKIEKANTPQVTLWGLSFSPDREKIAYTAFEWKDVPDSRPQPDAPFTINITDLNTGETTKILESQTDQFHHPIWSNDSLKIAYEILGKSVEEGDSGIYVVDINSKSSKLVTAGTKNSQLTVWGWLSDSKLIYSEESYTTGEVHNKVSSYLFTINIDGTDKQKVDTAGEITVFGVLR